MMTCMTAVVRVSDGTDDDIHHGVSHAVRIELRVKTIKDVLWHQFSSICTW